MMSASRDHVMDTGPGGITGHTGTDGSSPKSRCEKYVKVEGMSGENIDYGEKEPLQVILALAIDDGVPSRGHRTNIWQKGFKKFACFTGDHKQYGKQTVLNYNGSDSEMNDFMNAPVVFPAEPEDHMGYSQGTQVQMGGGKITKVTTRTYNMRDGS